MQTQVTRAGEIPLGNATRARIRFEHGGGQMTVRAGSDPGVLLAGDFGEHAEMDIRREAEQVDVTVRAVGGDWRTLIDPASWRGPDRPFDWNVELNPTILLALTFATGASKNVLDLSGLRVTEVILNTGMSQTELILPTSAGFTRVEAHASLADATIRVPSGVAARINGKVGLGSLTVDQARFPAVGDAFESPDFSAAANRVQVKISGGLEAVRVL